MDKNKENKVLINELYEKMCSNPDLCGNFKLNNGSVVWELGDGYTVMIARDYLSIGKKLLGGVEMPLTHWHPEDDELYDEACLLGTAGNITVIHDTFFYSKVVYLGPESDCKIRRKWLFGRYYYMRAKK